jgi:acetyl-CoA synthetase
VRNAFLPPTALKHAGAVGTSREALRPELRTVGSGGEALGSETLPGAATIRFRRSTSSTARPNAISSSAPPARARRQPRRARWARPIAGHEVAIIDDEATSFRPGEQGQIAVLRPDPVMFLEYWNNPDATEEKFIGDWMITGDQGLRDEDGYFHFVGRDDDVITSAGYRIGPGEIEDCITEPSRCGAGRRDRQARPGAHGQLVKAYIVLREGVDAVRGSEGDIRDFVKSRLSAHEYPREIEFVDEMPLTTTGKVIRRIFRERPRRKPRPKAERRLFAAHETPDPVAHVFRGVAGRPVKIELRHDLPRFAVEFRPAGRSPSWRIPAVPSRCATSPDGPRRRNCP